MFTSIRQHLLSTPTRHHSTAAGVPTAITNLATFKQHLASRPSSEVVLCQLHATWCKPCKMMTPVLKRVVSPPATGGASAANNVSLVMVDVDEVPDVAAAYRVSRVHQERVDACMR